MASEESRQADRQAVAEQERAEKELRARGVRVFGLPDFNEKDNATVQEILKVAAIAKQTSRVEISVRALDEHGKVVSVTDRVGHEDMIFMNLLMSRLAQLAQNGGRQ